MVILRFEFFIRLKVSGRASMIQINNLSNASMILGTLVVYAVFERELHSCGYLSSRVNPLVMVSQGGKPMYRENEVFNTKIEETISDISSLCWQI